MTVTLITGANRGIGLETSKQLVELGHTVYLGARTIENAERTAHALGGGARGLQLDVTDDASVVAALASIEAEEGVLDVLINNAGLFCHRATDSATATEVFDTNAIGVLRVTETALPLLRKSKHAVVVTVSSSMGSFWATSQPDRMEATVPAPVYAASKAAATMLTFRYALAEPTIKFNALEPGYTHTDMTAEVGGGRPVELSAKAVVQLATIGPDGPTGTLRDENGQMSW